jgi:predicted transposase/invertase (TIGR01784 family)
MLNDDDYVKAYSDIFVKYLFGSEGNEDILLDFINDVLSDSGFPLIKWVEVLNPFNIKEFRSDKLSILDVKAVDENERTYNIEIQSNPEPHYRNRILYYWARLYSSQMRSGEYYSLLRPVISINLLNYVLVRENNRLHNLFWLSLSDDPEIVLTDHIYFHFIEMPKFVKRHPELLSEDLEKWVYFYLYEGKEDEEKMKILFKDDEPLQKAHNLYKRFTKSDELREVYQNRIEAERRYNTALSNAEEKGRKEGMKNGRKEGMENGRKEEKIQTAKNMKNDGLDIEIIMKYTGLSRKDIEKL